MPRTVSKRLNALAITNANREGNLHDGGGLYLRVRADGSKSWAFRYTLAGRKHWMSLGPLRDVSLAEAREQARQLRNQVRDGYDPLACAATGATTAAIAPAVMALIVRRRFMTAPPLHRESPQAERPFRSR